MSRREDKTQERESKRGGVGGTVVFVKLVVAFILVAVIVGVGMFVGGIKVGSIPILKDIKLEQNGAEVRLADYNLGDKKAGDITLGQLITIIDKMTQSPEEIRSALVTKPVDATIPSTMTETYGTDADYTQMQYTATVEEISFSGSALGAVINNILDETKLDEGESGEDERSLSDLGLSMEQIVFKSTDEGVQVDMVVCLNLADLKDIPEDIKKALTDLNVGQLFLNLTFDMQIVDGKLVYAEDNNATASINNSAETTQLLIPLLNDITDQDCVDFICQAAGGLLGTLVENLGTVTGFDSNGEVKLDTHTVSP